MVTLTHTIDTKQRQLINNITCKNIQGDSEEYRLMITGQDKNLSYGVNIERYIANANAIDICKKR